MNCIPDTIKIVSTRPPEFLPLNPNSRPNYSYSPKARRRDPASWLKRGDINLEGLTIEDPFQDEKESNNACAHPESKLVETDPADDVPKDIAFLGESTAAIAFDLEDDLEDEEEMEICNDHEIDDEVEVFENHEDEESSSYSSNDEVVALEEDHLEVKHKSEESKQTRDTQVARTDSTNTVDFGPKQKSTAPSSSTEESNLSSRQVKKFTSRPRVDRSHDSDDDKSKESIAWEKPVWMTKKLRPSRRADASRVVDSNGTTSPPDEKESSPSRLASDERSSTPKDIASAKKQIEWEKPEWTKKKPLKSGVALDSKLTQKAISNPSAEEASDIPKTNVDEPSEATNDVPVVSGGLDDCGKKKKKKKKSKPLSDNDHAPSKESNTAKDRKDENGGIASSKTNSAKKVEWEKPSWAVKPALKSTSRGAAIKSGAELGPNDLK